MRLPPESVPPEEGAQWVSSASCPFGIVCRDLLAVAAPHRRRAAALLPQQPTFKAGTQVVSLFATVTDAQKRLVPDLTKDDFEVFDNEKPQPLVYFDNEIQPITVVVMLDTSGSMTLTIELLKQAAEQFLLRLLPDDKARVGAFNDKIQFSARFTNNRDQLSPTSKDLDYGNGTRLWDAVDASLDELKGIDGRSVVLVFTDGDDTESKTRPGHGDRSRARRRSDGLRDRPRERLLQRAAHGAQRSRTAGCGRSPTKPAAATSS